ncbi:DUF3046 domain-containing protein [Dermabacter sp. HSID17554]|uniref:DUF3046 domain-containing protein n=1 Tax=Dermabacter sp. HSID17554 TaxID=2419511 RepID=UPI000F884C30|nr:DUF3046 domain-containing protein [Dermabacter sp. HSID17554]RUP85625.1 DUF3046 domain-containing protein [Dermabacter sp. HSID17554]
MRRSEFRELAAYVFGSELAQTYCHELTLVACGNLSANEAIEVGYPVKDVWHALCDDMDVPQHRRWEVPPEARPRA